jgi:RecA-family ATPase
MSTLLQCPDRDTPPIEAYIDSCAVSPAKQCKPMPDKIDVMGCFTRTPPAYDFILPGFLTGTVGLLVSPGGAGKSMLALQTAASIATGKDMLRLGVSKTGDCLVIVGEDPMIALHHRLHDLGKHYSPLEMENIADRCDFRCVVGMGMDIMSDRWFDWLLAMAKGKRLVVIDTLTRIHHLDETVAGDAKQIMTRLEIAANETGAGVLVLHHVSKASATNGQGGEQQAARGSSVFVDNARWSSFLCGMTEKEAEGRKVSDRRKYVRWNVSKQNYSKPADDAWLERSAGGILVPADFRSAEEKAATYARASGKEASHGQVKVPVCSF